MIETHRAFTNRWECDENSHMNVQFYLKRFDEAARILDTLTGIDSQAHLIVRHVRYHSELHEGDGTITLSGRVEGLGQNGIAHVMSHSRTGTICTTAWDTLSDKFDDKVPVADARALEAAAPRGLSTGPVETTDARGLLADGKAVATNYSVVEALDLAPDGRMYTNRIVSRFTDGAPHIWDFAGVASDWLQENGYGRVAVEMKIMPIGKPQTGEALRLITFVPDRAERTFRVSHQLESLTTGEVIARGDVRCLIMDLEKRKAVHLPDSLWSISG